jgi:REP element-mobilizing transposase RayT
MPRKPRQIEIEFRSWGGARKNAGRKRKGKRSCVPHRTRPRLDRNHPSHVTLRLKRKLGNMRTKARLKIVRQSFMAACSRQGFRITDWSLQGDHIHLICEAKDSRCLSSGIKGFSVRLAKGINRLLGRKGAVFADRYHQHVLKTPREVRNALCYVLNNARRHGFSVARAKPDTFSSGALFDGWRLESGAEIPVQSARDDPKVVAAARTWLRTKGWRRHRLIGLDECPKRAS